MTNIWFTADTHFGHKNIIKYCNRPFESCEKMDETIIENWNKVVAKNDLVYHLGDFSLKHPSEYFSKLNGKIHLIEGNHDRRPKILKQYTESYSQIKVIKPKGLYIVLCHYSMRSWKYSHRGSWHLFGHSHGKLKQLGKSFDVGVDCHNYTPISLEEVSSIMEKLTPNENDNGM